MSTSRPARTATPTSFAGARRSRSTRTARTTGTTSKRGTSSRGGRRGGDSGAGLLRIITATQKPSRRWARVWRPPTTGLKFEIPIWVPVDQLTKDEWEEYQQQQSMHNENGNEPGKNKQLENSNDNNKAMAATSKEIHKTTTRESGAAVHQTMEQKATFVEREQIPAAEHEYKSQLTVNEMEAVSTSNPQMSEAATSISFHRASIPSAVPNANNSTEQGPPTKRIKLSESHQPGEVAVEEDAQISKEEG